MIGIEAVYRRIERYSVESRQRVNTILTTAAEIVVRALADEMNRSLQKITQRLNAVEERQVRLQQQLDRLEGSHAKST